MKLLPGDVFLGRFRVVRAVAEGGVGAVYEVVQQSNQARRALKVLHAQFARDPDVIALFKQEAWIASKIDSPHVVQVIDARAESSDEIPWLLLEWLDGDDLGQLMKARGRLPAEEIRAIYAELADVMGAAHTAGVVHCDLKPENIMLAQVHQRALVKVVDFGIARLILSSKTHATLDKPIGSPDWMAPEQILGSVARPAADVWAMGMIAFFLFTGLRYWRDPTNPANNELMKLLRRAVQGRMDPASVRARALGAPVTLPEGFDRWFARCTDRDDKQRFPNGRAAGEELVALLGGSAFGGLKSGPNPLPATRDLGEIGRFDTTPIEREAQRLADELERVEGQISPEEIIARGEVILAMSVGTRGVAEKVASASVALAWAQANRAELTTAIATVQRALSLKPRSGGPWYARAVFRQRSADLAGALDDIDRALQMDPRVAIFHDERGRVLHRLGRFEEALDARTRASELDARREGFWSARARTQLCLGRNVPAAEDYGRALELTTEPVRRAQLHHLRAQALFAARRWADALLDWAEATRLQPGDGMYWYAQSVAFRVFGDVPRAEESLARAASLALPAALAELDAKG